MKAGTGMRVALVHDWLTGMRGGEKVLESLCAIFPAESKSADVFTLFYVDDPGRISPAIRAHRITVSSLNRLPGAGRYYRYLLPLMPAAVESFDLRGYDLVISSSHAVAKGARVPQGVPHICYCHTPMRYLWTASHASPLRHMALSMFERHLRDWDVRSSAGVTKFIANSENVRCRIQKAYGRDAEVIYPPVDTEFFTPGDAEAGAGAYYLVVSALEPYKRVDLAIQAAMRLGRPLVVVGRGTEAKKLRRLAGSQMQVAFTGWVSDERLRELYRGCRALLFPGLEDFGMVPVEAQACGRPVIAFRDGGATETCTFFFDRQSTDSLIQAILDFEKSGADLMDVSRFSKKRFEDHIRKVLSTDFTDFTDLGTKNL